MAGLLYIAVGAVAGVLAGMFGVGGGLIIVPCLLWLMKFPIHTAVATSMVALCVPIGLMMSAYQFYMADKITNQHLVYGVLIAFGLAVGAFFGSRMALSLDQDVLRKCFAVFLVFAAVLTWFKP